MIFVKMLSISEADEWVTLVGLDICGMKEWVKFDRTKSFVGLWESDLSRSRL